MQRYEMIGKQWAQSGAGKKQHDIDVAEEKRMLAKAAIKEKADEDRELVRGDSECYYGVICTHTHTHA